MLRKCKFLRCFSTPDLCDHAESKGIPIRILDPVFKNFGGHTAFWGQAVTIKCHEDNSLVKGQAGLSAASSSSAASFNKAIMVVDGGASKRSALVGDMIAANAAKNGWAGFLVNGCVRDVDALAATPIGVQALAAHPKRTLKRNLGDLNWDVAFAGATIKPGDYVYCDSNGVVVSSEPLL